MYSHSLQLQAPKDANTICYATEVNAWIDKGRLPRTKGHVSILTYTYVWPLGRQYQYMGTRLVENMLLQIDNL